MSAAALASLVVLGAGTIGGWLASGQIVAVVAAAGFLATVNGYSKAYSP